MLRVINGSSISVEWFIAWKSAIIELKIVWLPVWIDTNCASVFLTRKAFKQAAAKAQRMLAHKVELLALVAYETAVCYRWWDVLPVHFNEDDNRSINAVLESACRERVEIRTGIDATACNFTITVVKCAIGDVCLFIANLSPIVAEKAAAVFCVALFEEALVDNNVTVDASRRV